MMKSLPKAIALAAAGLGMAVSAQAAVNVNPDGLGQVLLYPVYTTDNGNDTYISVTNTTNEFKAVKVRFLEGEQSREVLDFNLYLSPYDVWNGAISRTDAGAKLATGDNSCTAPAIPAGGVEFRGYEYGAGATAGERGRIGYVEVIEMGTVTDGALQTAIKHVKGVPSNCGAVVAAWQTGGTWANDNNAGISAPTGGLYGIGTIINVPKATEIGYDAVALDNFWDLESSEVARHTFTGSLFPNLGQGIAEATFKNGVTAEFDNGAQAVSAVLMKEFIANDFAVGAG